MHITYSAPCSRRDFIAATAVSVFQSGRMFTPAVYMPSFRPLSVVTSCA